MATDDELKKQQALNKALEEENAILRKRNKLQSEGYDMSSSLVESLKEVLGIRSRHSTFEQDILNTNKEINKSILSQKSGLQDLQSTKVQIRKNNDLVSKATTLQLGLEQSLSDRAKKSVESYVHKASLQMQMQKAIDAENEKLERGEQVDEHTLDLRKERLAKLDEIAQREFSLLGTLGKQYAISQLNTAELQKQTQERKKDKETLLKLQASMGIAGALVKTLGTIPGLGDASAKAFEDVERKLKADAEATGEVASRWKTFGMLASETGKHIAQGLTDPATILTSIFDTYLKINKASVNLLHLTGQNAVRAASWNTSYANAVDYLETAAELTKETGMNAQNVFSEKVIAQAAALKTTMGLTAAEAGNFALMSQTSGKNVDDLVDSVVDTTSAFNGANRAAVSQGVVLREVANTSESIKLSLGNNPEALTKAAAAATRLGLSLKDVDNIAASLTDFQSSISNELEAELLIGKDLNLEKARELALSNDLEGVSKELFKNSSDITEFGKMNRIQQEAYAKALGMTKDQLAKMAYNKAIEAGMTAEQAAEAANVNAEDMKRVAAQENFANALTKIAGALAPILDLVGNILSMPFVPYLLMGGFAALKLGKGILSAASGMGSMVKGAKDFVSNLNMKGVMDFFGKIKDSFSAGLGKKAEDTVKDAVVGKAEDAAAGLADKAKDKAGELVEGKVDDLADKAMGAGEEVPEKTGKGVGGLTESIQKIKPSQLLAGGAALLMVAGSVYIFAKAAQEFATVSWEDMAKAGVGLLGLVGALALVGAIMMSGVGALAILAGAAAIVIMAGGLYILGKALQEVGTGMSLMEPALALVSSIGDKAAGLATVGASLLGIAAGLREIADAGTGAIPVLEKLNTLGGNKSAGEAKGKADEGSLLAVEKKLDALIAAVKAGGDVYLDSNKVGKAQVLGSYKSD